MTTLWDTTGTDVVKALARERRTGGAITSGSALTLIAVAGERDVAEAELAVTTAAAHHPCRLLVVVRRQIEDPIPRLDAEVLIGGRLGPGEAVVMRMYGRLGLHAESVTLPLLAPDVPVVTWWAGEPPEKIAYDPLGISADRRITDTAAATDPVAALQARAEDYEPGDTDLAWTRLTPWRSQLAAAADTFTERIVGAVVRGNREHPSSLLLAGWLSNRLGVNAPVEQRGHGEFLSEVMLTLTGGDTVTVKRGRDGRALLDRAGARTTSTPLPNRGVGDLLAEELHRLEADQTYAEGLAAATGVRKLGNGTGVRQHIWRDPAQIDTGDRKASVRTSAGEEGTDASAAKAASGRPGSGSKPTAQAKPAGRGGRSSPARSTPASRARAGGASSHEATAGGKRGSKHSS